MLVIVLPPWPTSTFPVNINVAVPPAFNVPIVNSPVVELYVPCVTELEANVMPAGSESVSETLVA